MKKISVFISILFSIAFIFPTNIIYAQVCGNQYNHKNIKTDIHSSLQYEDRDIKASFSKDIFGARIYKDNKNNEISYSKEVWNDAFAEFGGNEHSIFSWLIDTFYDRRDVKEKYRRNIHGDLEYENKKYNASLSKNIFDDYLYKDSRNNEIKYSKEFWADIIKDFNDNEMHVFFSQIDQCHDRSNYKEEYTINIFGYQEYKNSIGSKASISKNIFDVMIYEDSRGNKIEFPKERWDNMIKRNGSSNKIFISLLIEYLFG